MLQDKRVQLLDVEVADTPARMLDLRTRPGIAFYDKLSKCVIVECAEDTWLAIRSLKTEARKALTAEQWWVGQSRGGQTIQLE
jgi:methionyl-tRNA formyltransferase